MSYCVNCGVELADSEKRCPLCNVEVINPARPWSEPTVRPYPEKLERIVARIDRSFFAGLAAVLLLIPVAITLLIDFLANGELSWSAYVVGGVALFFTMLVLPFIYKKPNIYVIYGADFSVLLLYLLLIDLLDVHFSWFVPLALPIVTVLAAFMFGLSLLFHYRLRSGWTRSAGILIALGCYTVVIEVVIDLYLSLPVMLNWSGYVLIPCCALAGALMILRGRKRLREELHRRLFL